MSLGERITAHRAAILGITALLALCGGWLASRMPVSILPEVTFNRIGVIARAPNLPVDQALTGVTQPLEEALSGVLGLQSIRSKTTRGGVEIDLRFDWNADMGRALQMALAAIEEARSALFPGTEIETRLLDTSTFPVAGIAIRSRVRGLGELSDFARFELAPELRTIDGVQRVELSGAKVREIALTVDPAALAAHRLDLETVEAALRSANVAAAAGSVREAGELALVVVDGAGTSVGSLADVVVSKPGASAVRLGDVARIESALREDFTRAADDGGTAVLVSISRQPSGNVVAISRALHTRLADLRRSHPDVTFSTVYDQADLAREAIASVRDSIFVGSLLAIAAIFLFIADPRTTLVVAAVVPAAVATTAIALHALGMSLNLMTLGGVAAGIGLVMDDAIVVVENLHRHRGLERDGRSALAASMGEITHALVGSTLTPVAVLLPFTLLTGVAGDFFRPLAITMAVALLLSLVFAVTFTPALAMALEGNAPRPVRHGPGERLAETLAGLYARLLRVALRRWWIAVVAFVALGVIALAAYQHLETGFVPEMDEGAFILDYWGPRGASLEETVALLSRVDAVLRETPEVESFGRRTGAELGFFLTDSNRGDYAVRLHASRTRPIEEIMDDVRGRIAERVPGLRVEFVQILQDVIGDLSGSPEPIEVKVFGRDFAAVQEVAIKAREAIATVPGLVDSFDGIDPTGPVVALHVDELRASRAGLGAGTVQHWLETAITGTLVGQVLEGDRALPLRVRFAEPFRDGLDATRGLTLVTPDAGLVPLASLGTLQTAPTAVRRERENLRQLARVTARLSGRDLGSVHRDVRDVLRHALSLPPGVSIEYGGLYANQQESFAELARVLLLSLTCVAALLLVEFGSVAAVVAIVAGSGLAVTGSVGALWLTGTALNVSSVVGMIMVIGIVAKNGILLLDFALRAGAAADPVEALVQAGAVRLRPILMTSLAAGAGLAPLALGWGAGGEMQQPLAIAILGGLSLSMVFSLFAVPIVYSWLAPARHRE